MHIIYEHIFEHTYVCTYVQSSYIIFTCKYVCIIDIRNTTVALSENICYTLRPSQTSFWLAAYRISFQVADFDKTITGPWWKPIFLTLDPVWSISKTITLRFIWNGSWKWRFGPNAVWLSFKYVHIVHSILNSMLFLFLFSDFKISSDVFFSIILKEKPPKSIDHQNLGATLDLHRCRPLGKPPEVRRASLEPQHGSWTWGDP